jgi:hypothetical protein
MNKNYFLGVRLDKILMLTLSVLIWAGCKKDNDTEQPKVPVCNISKFEDPTNSLDGGTMEYDSNNRLVKIKLSDINITNIAYTQGKVTITNADDEEVYYNLDAQGRVSTYTENDSKYSISYAYNNDGYLNTADEKEDGVAFSHISFTYTDGNLVKINRTDTSNGNEFTSETSIEYSDEAAFNFLGFADPLSAVGNINYYLSSFFGKASKNQVKKVTTTGTGIIKETIPNTIVKSTNILTYTYEKNSNGKMSSVSEVSSSQVQIDNDSPQVPSNSSSKYLFTYTCH